MVLKRIHTMARFLFFGDFLVCPDKTQDIIVVEMTFVF